MTGGFWNRNDLYLQVWEQPLNRLSEKYGISDVALGKICRKLRIPLPGRGYWARRAAGKKVSVRPLPKFDKAPRISMPSQKRNEPKIEPEPTDSEYVQIKQIESTAVDWNHQEEHPLVARTRKSLEKGREDDKGLLHARSARSLDVTVSRQQVDRALVVMNGVLMRLQQLGFKTRISDDKTDTEAHAFGRWASFRIKEKTKEKERKVVNEGNWRRTIITYAPSGVLEFRAGNQYYSTNTALRDHKNKPLQAQISMLVGLVLREARQFKDVGRASTRRSRSSAETRH